MKTALRLLFHLVVALLAIIGLHALLFPEMACAQPADLVRVNDEVNRSIRYRSDLDQYGRPDYWVGSPASNEGDCEDYALTKYDRLGRGRVVVVGWQNERIHRLRGFHAVLVVDGWVLDNIERRVVPVETARRYYTGL
jgi:predicted transglutaminase-like cysteine proteinase